MTRTSLSSSLPSSPNRKAQSAAFAAYLSAFFCAWTVYVALLYPRVLQLGADSLAYALLTILFKSLIWILPVIWYVRRVLDRPALDYLRLRGTVARGLLWTAGLSIADLLLGIALFGLPHLTARAITWNNVLSASVAVGFVEEIPFRGLIYRWFCEQTDVWIALLASSLFFTLFHLPGWLLLSHAISGVVLVQVFFTGIVLALAVQFSRSLWSAILAHSFNDFLAFVVFQL